MTFKIDTGHASTLRMHLPDWFLDDADDTDSDYKLAHDYALHMAWKTKQPVKLETVREHLIASWPTLFMIGKLYPEMLDEVLIAYAERAMTFDQPNAA